MVIFPSNLAHFSYKQTFFLLDFFCVFFLKTHFIIPNRNSCTNEIILYDLNLKDLITSRRHGPIDHGFIQVGYVIGTTNLQAV